MTFDPHIEIRRDKEGRITRVLAVAPYGDLAVKEIKADFNADNAFGGDVALVFHGGRVRFVEDDE